MADALEDRLAPLLRDRQMDQACRLVLQSLGAELRGYLRGVMGNPHDAEDLYQEVSAALWQRLPHFEGRSSVRTWLYAIAHNLACKRLQRCSRRHQVRLDTLDQERIPARSMTSLLEGAAREQQVADLREQLTPQERELLILRSERGFSIREIAGILEITEATAKQRCHRLKEKLKALTAQHAAGG